MRKVKLILLVGAIAIAGIASVYFLILKDQPIKIALTQDELQKRLNEKIPYRKKKLLLIATILTRIDKASVYLPEKANRIGVKLDVGITLEGDKPSETAMRWYKANLDIHSSVVYRGDQHTFYMKDPFIEQIHIEGIPALYSKKLKKTMNKAVKDYLTTVPVYKLKPEDFKKSLTRALLKDVEVKNNQLVLTLVL
jgi:hypothetical protein